MSMKPGILLAAACLLGCTATSGRAQIINDPPWNYSIVPSLIILVGRDGNGVADGMGEFQVKVRSFTNQPVANSQIFLEFSETSSVQLCASQGQSVSSVHCSPGLSWVKGSTDADGIWTATILGCSSGPAMASIQGNARIYADGVLLGFPRVALLDLGGCDGTGGNDLSIWLSDFASGLNPQRSDYDGSELLGANDLSIWLNVYGSGASALNCGSAVCH